jgi:5-dehydro-2-deoxygluconokinase
MREQQERQLLRLFDACRKTRHELLVEVILPRDMASDIHTVARAIRRLYSLGIRPDWWKLEPVSDPAAWREISAAVNENDPLCRGVVLLGLSAPEAELLASFEVAAPFPIIKGFAVGRTIFYDVAREWLSNRMDDEAAVAALAGKFKVLVDAWRRLRGAVEKAA